MIYNHTMIYHDTQRLYDEVAIFLIVELKNQFWAIYPKPILKRFYLVTYFAANGLESNGLIILIL